MEILVNTRLLLKDKLEGIGWFTYETLKRITQNNPDHHFIFAFDRPFNEEFIFSDNITPVELFPQARHPFLYIPYFEWSLRSLIKDMKPDLFLSPDGYLSLGSKVKQLPVIHDLNFEHYPQDLPFIHRKYYQYFFPRYAHKASRIATVSEFSKSDISKTYNISLSKIDVVFNGYNSLFKPLDEAEKEAIKVRFSEGCDYFVFVGSLHPRKNIARLFQAFDKFKNSFSSNIKLVIVGKKKWWTSEIEQTYNALQNKTEVIFTDRLSEQDLAKVMGAALALTFVPYFEGFGIPIVEAMASNTAVITSNVTSMPEVAGEAALLVDPFSIESISGAMLLIAKDESIRKRLVELGQLQKKQFSWDKTAQLLWESVERTIKS